jgi:hypothetical protein
MEYYIILLYKIPVYRAENTVVAIRHANQVAPSIRKKLALSSQTSGGRSVGTGPSQTQATELLLYKIYLK